MLDFLGNAPFHPVILSAIRMEGMIFTRTNLGFVARELANQLKDSEAKFILFASESLEMVVEATATVWLSKDKSSIFDDEVAELARHGSGCGIGMLRLKRIRVSGGQSHWIRR